MDLQAVLLEMVEKLTDVTVAVIEVKQRVQRLEERVAKLEMNNLFRF